MNHDSSEHDLDRLGDALRASTTVDLARQQQAGLGADEPVRARRLRRPALAGGTLGLAGVGAALVLILGAGGASAPPAFAVTPHHDGTVSVKIYRKSGIVGANRKLAALGIHERLRAATVTASGRTVSTTTVHGKTITTSFVGTIPSGPEKCLKDQTTGGVVGVIFASAAQEKQRIVDGTYVPPADAGNTGGTPNNGPWHVVICPPSYTTPPGAGNSGNTGATGNTGGN